MPAFILASLNPLEHVVQQNLTLGARRLSVTNHIFMVLLAAVSLSVLLIWTVRRQTIVPKGWCNLVEMICSFIRDQVARPTLGEYAERYLKFLWTMFFFIAFCNLLGMLPLEALIHLFSAGRLRHWGGTATANVWVTGALAAVSFVVIHISGILQQGIVGYVRNFTPRVPWFFLPLMYFLEMIGALVKPFALAIRLFANMMAGHLVLAAFLGLIVFSRNYALTGVTVLGCAALSVLELFVALLQAYIFTFLTALFLGAALNPEH